MPTTVLDQVINGLGLERTSLTSQEIAVMQLSVDAMLQSLRQYTGRYLSRATWVDSFMWNGDVRRQERKIILAEYPVTSVASITRSGTLLTSDQFVVNNENGTLYYVDKGGTIWDWWIWDGFRYTDDLLTTIQYTAGYDPLPSDLLMLLADFTRERLRDWRTNAKSVSAVSGEVSSIQIEGVGRVQYRSGVGGVISGYNAATAAEGGPIMGAGVAIADQYRDMGKVVFPDDHIQVIVP